MMSLARTLSALVVIGIAGAVTPTLAAPQCETAVASYNKLAGQRGVPDVLRGWTAENAASFRFHDSGDSKRPTADSGVTCNADGSLEKFEFALSWTGNPPLEAMASAQIAVETMASAVAPEGPKPNFSDLMDRALDNAEMLHLATQAEWAPIANGYQAYASITRNAAGGAITYAVRQAH